MSYQASIQDLLEQLETEKLSKEVNISETIKLKKALILKETDETIGNFSKEEIQRYKHRLHNSEAESVNYEIEIAKLTRNQEYFKSLLKTKDEIILKLEIQLSRSHSVTNMNPSTILYEKSRTSNDNFEKIVLTDIIDEV